MGLALLKVVTLVSAVLVTVFLAWESDDRRRRRRRIARRDD